MAKMKDFLGNELEIGDEVVYIYGSRSCSLAKGIVKGFTNSYVILTDSWDSKKLPEKCIKIKH